jgi:hypothetical protein
VYSLVLEAQSSRDSLTQSVQQLQSTTGDAYYTLLEKIIDISTRVKPLPSIPETAREKYVMALSLRDDANKTEDFEQPLSFLKAARTLAPWWPEVHKELGLTFEMDGAYNAQFYDNAIYNFNNFLLTKPIEVEARKIQDEIYIVKAKKEKAIQKQQEEKINAENERLKSLEGYWERLGYNNWSEHLLIEKLPSGSFKVILDRGFDNESQRIKTTFVGTGSDQRIEFNQVAPAGLITRYNYYTCELSKDGNSLTLIFKSIGKEANKPDDIGTGTDTFLRKSSK